ncbi:MAG: ATP-binding cassette domain-containing protein [Anaerolineales bacterium]
MGVTQRKDPIENDVVLTKDLTKKFGDQTAVDSLNLHVPRGSIFGFIGPSGCGKTTTVRFLAGIHEPTSGEANVLGKNLVDLRLLIRCFLLVFGFGQSVCYRYPSL